MGPRFLLVYDEGFTRYDVPPSYAFSGQRFKDFFDFLLPRMPRELYEVVKPRKATREDLLRVHSEEYLNYVEQLANEIPGSFLTYLTADTQVERDMLEANKLMVGATMMGVELAKERALPVYTFGGLHHAGPSRGGGFCVLNDVAAAARHARDIGMERVMVVDTDAHAGDGTMDIFYDDPTVLAVSVHHDPTMFYPQRGFVEEIGEGKGAGYSVNFPMPPFAGIKCYQIFRDDILLPIASEFKPQIIIRNGGSDPYALDITHLGYQTSLGLSKADLHTLGGWVGSLRDELGALYLDIMGSGYDLAAIPSCWYSLMTGTLNIPHEATSEPLPREVDDEKRISATRRTSESLRRILAPYWGCFSR